MTRDVVLVRKLLYRGCCYIENLKRLSYEVDFAGDSGYTFYGVFLGTGYAGGHVDRKKDGGKQKIHGSLRSNSSSFGY